MTELNLKDERKHFSSTMLMKHENELVRKAKGFLNKIVTSIMPRNGLGRWKTAFAFTDCFQIFS